MLIFKWYFVLITGGKYSHDFFIIELLQSEDLSFFDMKISRIIVFTLDEILKYSWKLMKDSIEVYRWIILWDVEWS